MIQPYPYRRGAENAELSQRRPEGAEKREGKRNTLSLLLSLRTLGVLRASAVEGSSITK
jgi:hypothetical protein